MTRTAVAAILGAALVICCYYFVDRPVAWFFHQHSSPEHRFWFWAPRLSNWLKGGAAPALMLVLLWCLWRPGGRMQTVLLALSASLVVTTGLKIVLKWTCGRYWPEPWHEGYPSLISNGAYGFHPFQRGAAYGAFPSGHASLVCCCLSVLWLAYPRGRWFYALACALVCALLVAMNYHFVGDVVAGVLLGTITGVYMAYLFRLQPPRGPGPDPAHTGTAARAGSGSPGNR
ncbi:MAG: phosphatase PAP2 family protein [Thermoguttaceae bacterium]